jgi:hypothetical protein
VDHMIPGEGFIHWPEVCAELAHARYDRPLMLEVATTHSAVKEPREFLRLAHKQGLQLANATSGGSSRSSRGIQAHKSVEPSTREGPHMPASESPGAIRASNS